MFATNRFDCSNECGELALRALKARTDPHRATQRSLQCCMTECRAMVSRSHAKAETIELTSYPVGRNSVEIEEQDRARVVR